MPTIPLVTTRMLGPRKKFRSMNVFSPKLAIRIVVLGDARLTRWQTVPEGTDGSGSEPAPRLLAGEGEGDAILTLSKLVSRDALGDLQGDGLDAVGDGGHAVRPVVGDYGGLAQRRDARVVRVVRDEQEIDELVRRIAVLRHLTVRGVDGVHVRSDARFDDSHEAKPVVEIVEEVARVVNGDSRHNASLKSR